MDREDPQMYSQYRSLKESTKEQWQQELITKDFERLETPSENTWIIVSHLLDLIPASKDYVDLAFKRLLLQIIEISPILDKRQRILILEDFTGRNGIGLDSGIYWILTKTSHKGLLLRALNALSDFPIDESDNTSETGWENMQQRYDNVQKAIQFAIQHFGSMPIIGSKSK